MATDAQWDNLGKAMGIALIAIRDATKYSKSFTGYENILYPIPVDISTAETVDYIDEIKLYGLDAFGDTDLNGNMSLVLSAATDPATSITYVYICKSAVAVASAIASGTMTNTSASTVTLTADNDSGVSGTITISGFDTAGAYVHILVPRWSMNDRADDFDATVASDYDLSEEYSAWKTAFKNQVAATGNAIVGQAAALEDSFKNDFFRGPVAEFIDSGHKDDGTLLNVTFSGSSGTVSWTYSGIVKDFDDRMDTDSEYFLKNTTSAASLASGAGQQGAMQGSPSLRDYCQDADTYRFECVKTLDSTTEEYDVSTLKLGDAERRMRLGQSYDSPRLGFSVTMSRYMAVTGSAASAFTDITSATITGETSSYVTDTTLYGELITSATSKHTINLWKDSARSVTKVATGTRTGDGAISCTTYGGSGITFAATIAGITDGDREFALDLNVSQVGDYFTFVSANDEAGLFATMLGRIFEYEFPVTSSGNETIPEGYARNWEDFLTGKFVKTQF